MFGGATYVNPFTDEFEEIANNILAGKGFAVTYVGTTYRNYEEPLYVWITAGVYLLTDHSKAAMLLVQILFSVVLVCSVYFIAQDIFNQRTANLAGFLVAFHPSLVYFSVAKLEYTVFSAMLASLCILATLNFYKNRSMRYAFYLGLLFGFGILGRGAVVIFAVCSLLWLGAKRILTKKTLFVIILTTFVIMLPWTIRNYIVYGKVMLLKTNAPGFWYGNNENSIGTGHGAGGVNLIDSASEDFKSKFIGKDETEQDRFLMEEGKKFVLNHPEKALGLFVKKIFYFWWFPPVICLNYPQVFFSLYRAYYIFIILFAIAGLIYAFADKGFNNKAKCSLLLMYFLFLTLLHAVYYVEGRHRWTIEPLILIFTAYGILELKKKFPKLSQVRIWIK